MAADPRTSPTTRVWKLTSGKLEEVFLPDVPAETPNSLNSVSARLPGGAYTTFRTYAGGRVLRLSEHIDRLRQTARSAGWELPVDEAELRGALRVLVAAGRAVDQRLRLTLDLEKTPGDLYITVQELHAPSELAYRLGVKVVTCRLQRDHPQAKRTDFIARAEKVRRNLAQDVEEAVLLGPQGELLEGLSSNFFAVQAGQLWTSGEGVLSGVTRSLLLECARQHGIPVLLQPVFLDDIAAIDEAFITSSSRGVMPVVQIDNHRLGDGCPGSLTRRLMDWFQALVIKELQEI